MPPAKKARKSATKEDERQRVLDGMSSWRWHRRGDPHVPDMWADYNDDKEIAWAAVRNSPNAFQFLSARLRNDRELALHAFKRAEYWETYTVLNFVSDELKDDFEFGKALLSNCPSYPSHTRMMLRSLSDRLRGNREIVLMAVGLYGPALEHAGQELCGDQELVLTAMADTESVLQFASPELRGDKQLVMKAIKDRNSRNFHDKDDPFLVAVSKELKDDREVLEAILPKQDYEIFHASDRLQNCPSLLAMAFENVPKREFYNHHHKSQVQRLVQRHDRCLVIKNRLAKLKALLKARKFPTRRYPRRLTPSGFADRIEADLIHCTWCIQQVVSAHKLPCELADRIFAYSSSSSTTTTHDYHLAKEIRSLGPFLKAGADKFSPPYASWWVFLTGKGNDGWMTSSSH